MSEWDFDCPKYVDLPKASDGENDCAPENYFDNRKEDGVFRRMTRSVTAALGIMAAYASREVPSSSVVKPLSDASAASTPADCPPARASTLPFKENCHPEEKKPTYEQTVEHQRRRQPLRAHNANGSHCRTPQTEPVISVATKTPDTLMTVKKPAIVSTTKKRPIASVAKKPLHATSANILPTASAAKKPPHASAARKPPTASTAKKILTASAARKPPYNATAKKPSTVSAAKKSPRVLTARKPFTAPTTRKPPTAARKPPYGASAKKPPTASAAKKSPHASSVRKPPIASTVKKPPITLAGRKPPTASATRKPPYDASAKKLPTASAAKKSPHASTARKSPHASTARKSPHASTARKSPHASTARKSPHASTARKPPIASTARKPPIASTARKPPIASTARKPPIASTARKPSTSSIARKPPTASTARKCPTAMAVKKPAAAASRTKPARKPAASSKMREPGPAPAAMCQSLAEFVGKFQTRTPIRFRRNFIAEGGQRRNMEPRKPTIPVTPNLMTRLRSRAACGKDQEEHVDVSKPKKRKVTSAQDVPSATEPASSMKPESRSMVSMLLLESLSTKSLKISVEKLKLPRITVARSPAFALKMRSETWKQRKEKNALRQDSNNAGRQRTEGPRRNQCREIMDSQKRAIQQKEAAAVKQAAVLRRRSLSQQFLDRQRRTLQRKKPTVEATTTVKQVEPPKFRAQPAPDPKRVFRPRGSSAQATKPRPFRLASVERHEKCQEEFRRKAKLLETERVKMVQFVAKPAPAFLKGRRKSANGAEPATSGHVSRPRRR